MGAAAHRLARHPAGPRDGHVARRSRRSARSPARSARISATRTRRSSSPMPRRSISRRSGPRLEHDPLFPERANIGVATVRRPRGSIRLRVWERGAGITRACGSGACAALVAAHRRGLTGRRRDGRARRRRSRHRLARDDGHAHHDRPGGARLRGRVRRRPVRRHEGDDRGRDHHLRLPAERLRERGDPRRGRRGRACTTRSSSTPAPSPPKPSGRPGRRSAAPGASIPNARIIVTGCAATLSPERYAALAEVDLVLDNAAKLQAGELCPADPHPPRWRRGPLSRSAGEGRWRAAMPLSRIAGEGARAQPEGG